MVVESFNRSLNFDLSRGKERTLVHSFNESELNPIRIKLNSFLRI